LLDGWLSLYPNNNDRQRGGALSNIPQFLVHSPKDNVGVVVVEGLKAGTDMLGVVTETDSTIRVTARQDIPIGHKVALTDLKEGDTVIKYGQDVGRMVGSAKVGEHVHIHNHRTKRW
jgi:(2R)-sulfolactate sulfo-lyase subunit alpha